MWRLEVNVRYLCLSSFTLFFEIGSLIEPGTCWLAGVAESASPGILLSPLPKTEVNRYAYHFFSSEGAGDLNSNLHTYTASTLHFTP